MSLLTCEPGPSLYRSSLTSFCSFIIFTLQVLYLKKKLFFSILFLPSISKFNFTSSFQSGCFLFPFLLMAHPWEFAVAPQRGVTTQSPPGHLLLLLQPNIHAKVASCTPCHPQEAGEWLGVHPGMIICWLCDPRKAANLSVFQPPASRHRSAWRTSTPCRMWAVSITLWAHSRSSSLLI